MILIFIADREKCAEQIGRVSTVPPVSILWHEQLVLGAIA
jgi:hypothetical protein